VIIMASHLEHTDPKNPGNEESGSGGQRSHEQHQVPSTGFDEWSLPVHEQADEIAAHLNLQSRKGLACIEVQEGFVANPSLSRNQDTCRAAVAALLEGYRSAYEQIHAIVGDEHPLDLPFWDQYRDLEQNGSTTFSDRQRGFSRLSKAVWHEFSKTVEERSFLSPEGKSVASLGYQMKEVDKLLNILICGGKVAFLDAVACNICATKFKVNAGHHRRVPDPEADFRVRLYDPAQINNGGPPWSSSVLKAYWILAAYPETMPEQPGALQESRQSSKYAAFCCSQSPAEIAARLEITDTFTGRFADKNLLNTALELSYLDLASRGWRFVNHAKQELLYQLIRPYLPHRVVITASNPVVAGFVAENLRVCFEAAGVTPILASQKPYMSLTERKKNLARFRKKKGNLLVVSNLSSKDKEALSADCVISCEPAGKDTGAGQLIRHLSAFQKNQPLSAALPTGETLSLGKLITLITLDSNEAAEHARAMSELIQQAENPEVLRELRS
jgi:hypothetical protein